ncbi:MAG: cytochrome c [Terracidiphilus sp.]
MNTKHFIMMALVVAMVSAIAVTAQQSGGPQAKPYKDPVRKQAAAKQDDGERVFQQHCSRCHTAPDGFSPRISGTVVRHMRVRASLSQHEEQELLHFFNP